MTEEVTATPVAAAVPAAAPAATTTPAVTPAQPAAPVQGAAPAAQPTPGAADTGEVTPVTWAPTGDPGLDMATNFIGQRGFGPQHPAVKAAVQGDFTLLRAELAGMGAKATGYEAYIALAEKAYEQDKSQHEARAAASVQAVHAAVGGEESWEAIRQWAHANADDDERAEINAMVVAGPRQAKAAALYLKTLYENANGSVQAPANVAKPNASGGFVPSSNSPITDAREYARAVLELEKKVGKSHIQDSPEYQQLKQRRLAGRRIAR